MTGGYDEIPFVCLASQEVQGGEKVVRGKYWRKLWLEARSRRAPYSAFPPPPRLRVAQRPPSQNFSSGRQSQGGSGVETARWVSLSQLGGFLFFFSGRYWTCFWLHENLTRWIKKEPGKWPEKECATCSFCQAKPWWESNSLTNRSQYLNIYLKGCPQQNKLANVRYRMNKAIPALLCL